MKRMNAAPWVLLGNLVLFAEDTAPAQLANTKIAFQSDRDGNWEIYVMNSDGSNQTNLTNNPADDVYSDWSPDGSKIAFASDRDGNYEIYVMNSDGTNQTRITNNSADDNRPSWSPDGMRIAFESDRTGNYEILVMDADGTNPSNLTNNPAIEINPHYSPDGTMIEFASYRGGLPDIFVMNVDGTNVRQLTYGLWTGQAAWSPDGFKIAYSYDRYVAVMNADGTNQTIVLTLSCCPGPSVGSWSHDGNKIVFGTDRLDGNWEIYLMNADGSSLSKLTNDLAFDDDPSWSPFLFGSITIAVSLSPSSGDGTFDYTLDFTNLTDSSQTIDIWTEVVDPRGIRREDQVVYGRTLLGGRSYSRTTTKQLGDNKPQGEYAFTAYVGTYPDEVMDSSSATYTKTSLEKGSLTEGKEIPKVFEVSDNYPNPFNPSTTIEYGLPQDTYVRLEVYNVLGERVSVLSDGLQDAGYHSVVFEPEGLLSGMYFYRLQAGNFVETKKLIILR